MKIVYITTGLYTGGAENMLYKLLSKINRERFNPVVVSLMDHGTVGDRIASLGVPVYTIGMKSGMPTPAAIWKLIRTMRQLKPDLIQGWMYHGNLAALVAKFFSSPKIPVLWGIRCSVYSLALQKRMTASIIKFCAALSRFTTEIVFVSQIAKKQHETLGYPSEKNSVIPNGFETSLFTPSSEARLNVRSELGLAETSFLIGLIARYHPMKDHTNFLHAAALLLKSYPDVHFVLVGREVHTENKVLKNLIQDLGISQHIHLLGERRDMNRLTAALDIACSASAYGEGFPNVIGEAMSCGVPCAVTDVGDSGWIVGNTGRVVPPRSPEALAHAWKELIVLGSEGREILGKAARARIIECFSLDSVVHQYESLYESALAKKVN
jgi:glycosyltransferase involved in cell wall biosynthesis